MNTRTILVGSVVVVLALGPAPGAQQAREAKLVPTNHPAFSTNVAELWLVPEKAARSSPQSDLARGASMVAAGDHAKALPILSQPSLQQGPLAGYARYYAATAQLKLGSVEDARRAFRTLQDSSAGYLAVAAALGEAEASEVARDFRAAETIYERLLTAKAGAADDLWMRLARAAKAAEDTDKAREAFARVYYDFPLSDLAAEAGTELPSTLAPPAAGSERYKQELVRAERLFASKQYAPARAAFDRLRAGARGDGLDLVRLRLAECDYFLKRMRTARDAIQPLIAGGPRQAEALYYYALASTGLRDEATYLKTIRRVADEFSAESWAADALDHLATHHILRNDDGQADEVLRELYAKYPRSAFAERAAWKIGWRSYRSGRYGETASYFAQAAGDFPRSDYRPAWLYWAGRAHEALMETTLASNRFALATADYLNSYYGRLAVKRFNGRPTPRLVSASADITDRQPPSPPPNGALVRSLLDAGLFDAGLGELGFAERTWGGSPAIDATRAWIYRQLGRTENGTEQFNHYRGSINTMKRAYPQFLAAGGETLPADVLTTIFPLEYWDLIQKHSTDRRLDPYVVAALMAQESTFVPDIVSYAKAVGLMQIIPPTARILARKLKLPYSAGLSRNPEANVRMGTTYLAELIAEFGHVHLALAGYNAGEGAVRRWVAERPGIEAEEFIDDIPYPQTQGYVKKILGTAEDYRRLYAQ